MRASRRSMALILCRCSITTSSIFRVRAKRASSRLIKPAFRISLRRSALARQRKMRSSRCRIRCKGMAMISENPASMVIWARKRRRRSSSSRMMSVRASSRSIRYRIASRRQPPRSMASPRQRMRSFHGSIGTSSEIPELPDPLAPRPA